MGDEGAVTLLALAHRPLGPGPSGHVAEAPYPSHRHPVEPLRQREALEDAAVLELEEIEARRVGVGVQLAHLGDELLRLGELVQDVVERLLYDTIRPIESTTRIPSVVDSRVDCSSETARRPSASATLRAVRSR